MRRSNRHVWYALTGRWGGKPDGFDVSTRNQKSWIGFLGPRLLLVLLGFSPFILLEMSLRTIWPKRTVTLSDPFLNCEQLTPLFYLDGDDYRIQQEHLKLFAPAHFPANKKVNTSRVFCLGGSTTQGEPYKPPTAFPTWLQLNLELVEPNKNWEIINCGGLSYASYRMLPILIEILQYQPDLVILECGHNEFLEERELSGWQQSPVVNRGATRIAQSSRLIQFAADGFRRVFQVESTTTKRTRLEREVDALLDDQGGLEKYRRDELNINSVVTSMRWNLVAMVRACQKSGVPVALLVPTSNVRDCPPFKVELGQQTDVASKKQIEALWARATSHAENPDPEVLSGNVSYESGLREKLEKILAIDPGHAAALYWLGKLELANGQTELARRHLVSARDNDVCPLRAITSVQQAIREIATQEQTWCLDIDSMFASVSEHGLVGDRWLIDHVHPRIEGHQMLGEQLADLLVEKKWVKPTEKSWRSNRSAVYRDHLVGLGEDYFIRGKQRLAGLILWTQGRTRKGLSHRETEP